MSLWTCDFRYRNSTCHKLYFSISCRVSTEHKAQSTHRRVSNAHNVIDSWIEVVLEIRDLDREWPLTKSTRCREFRTPHYCPALSFTFIITSQEFLPSTNPTDCSWRFRVDSWRYNRLLNYSLYSMDSDLCNCFTPVSYLVMSLPLPSVLPSLASSFNPCLSHLSLQYSTSPIKIIHPLPCPSPCIHFAAMQDKKKTAKGNSNVKCKHANLRPNH